MLFVFQADMLMPADGRAGRMEDRSVRYDKNAESQRVRMHCGVTANNTSRNDYVQNDQS